MLYAVNEHFASIQGESNYAGYACYFIRFQGCPLRCAYCDTPYALEEDPYLKKMDTEALLAAVEQSCLRLLELTGGEPLVQPEIGELAQRFLDRGYTVLAETNGAAPLDAVPPAVIKIMDIKTPSSHMEHTFRAENVPLLNAQDEIKCVIADEADFAFSLEKLVEYDLIPRVRTIHFSPCADRLDPAVLSAWIMKTHEPKFRLNLQLHKQIWPHVERGV